jgi:hypothetical protein
MNYFFSFSKDESDIITATTKKIVQNDKKLKKIVQKDKRKFSAVLLINDFCFLHFGVNADYQFSTFLPNSIFGIFIGHR